MKYLLVKYIVLILLSKVDYYQMITQCTLYMQGAKAEFATLNDINDMNLK